MQVKFIKLKHYLNQFYLNWKIKIHIKKHEIKVTPITLCSYKWQGNSYKYHVYGNENKVFAPDYPNKYFCSVL